MNCKNTHSRGMRRLIAHSANPSQTSDLFLYFTYIACALICPCYVTPALLPDSCLLQSLFLLPAYFHMSTPPSISAGGNPSYGTAAIRLYLYEEMRGEGMEQWGRGGLNWSSYLVNSGLEDNLGLACDLHFETNWKANTHINVLNE